MAGVLPSANSFTKGNVMLVGNSYNSPHHATSQFLNSNSYNQQLNSPKNSSNPQNSSLNNGSAAAMNQTRLVPSLRMKSNEFFFKWITDRERGDQLNEIIGFIKANNRIPKPTDLQFKVSYFVLFLLKDMYIHEK